MRLMKLCLQIMLLTLSMIGNAQVNLVNNTDLEFEIVKELINYKGVLMSGNYVIQIDNCIENVTVDELSSVIDNLKNSKKTDFSALIFLYAYTKKDATKLFGLLSLDVNSKSGKYKCSKRTLNEWRETQKNEEIVIWENWYKSIIIPR